MDTSPVPIANVITLGAQNVPALRVSTANPCPTEPNGVHPCAAEYL